MVIWLSWNLKALFWAVLWPYYFWIALVINCFKNQQKNIDKISIDTAHIWILYPHRGSQWASLHRVQYIYSYLSMFIIEIKSTPSLHFVAIRYTYSISYKLGIFMITSLLAMFFFIFTITCLYIIYFLIFLLCILQILVSCFVKTSRHEEYFRVKVRILSSMSKMWHVIFQSVIIIYLTWPEFTRF